MFIHSLKYIVRQRLVPDTQKRAKTHTLVPKAGQAGSRVCGWHRTRVSPELIRGQVVESVAWKVFIEERNSELSFIPE